MGTAQVYAMMIAEEQQDGCMRMHATLMRCVGIQEIPGIGATRTRLRRLPFMARAPPFCSPDAMFCSARCSPNEHHTYYSSHFMATYSFAYYIRLILYRSITI